MSGFALKLVALITMIIDHTGALLQYYDGFGFMRSIGRVAFPIYAFLIAEGLHKTRDIRKYLARLLAFAFISQLPFDLLYENLHNTGAADLVLIRWDYLNVFFTLFIGGLSVFCFEKLTGFKKETGERRLPAVVGIIAAQAAAFTFFACAELLNTDYGFFGAMLIFLLYYVNNRGVQIAVLLLFIVEFYAGAPWSLTRIADYVGSGQLGISNLTVLPRMLGITEMFACACAAPLLVCFYNGKRGPGLKYFFYAAYPVHLLALAGVWFWYVKPSLFG